MAESTCPKCDCHSFEMVESTPKNAAWRYIFVQCASCGAVVGVADFINNGGALTKIGQRLGIDVT